MGLKGIEELEFINSAISALGLNTATLQLDVTLAKRAQLLYGEPFLRSLLQKALIWALLVEAADMMNLTSIFGKPDTSGVGISFGLDRIYLVLEELNLFPETIANITKVLFINFGDKEALACLKAVTQLRKEGVKAELYPDSTKMKKQMTYANRRHIPFVVFSG